MKGRRGVFFIFHTAESRFELSEGGGYERRFRKCGFKKGIVEKR